jgi:hypothetical protein
MNFLAHSYRFLDDPHFAAGACLPDWLGMADRRCRVRKREAERLADSAVANKVSRSIAAGIVQHLHDDGWFHESSAFVELSARFSGEIAEHLGGQPGMRSALLGHVLVELLLDSALAEQSPGLVEEYYQTITRVDVATLQATVNELASRPTGIIVPFVARFLDEKFLYDYLEDRPLLKRLNGIMRRVNLAEAPDSMCAMIQRARRQVKERWRELLGEK